MTTPITIIIADDHPIFRRGVREVIESDLQMQVLLNEDMDAGVSGYVLKDNLSEAIRFLEDYPASSPRPIPGLDGSSSPWRARGPAASGVGAEGSRRTIGSSTAADP